MSGKHPFKPCKRAPYECAQPNRGMCHHHDCTEMEAHEVHQPHECCMEIGEHADFCDVGAFEREVQQQTREAELCAGLREALKLMSLGLAGEERWRVEMRERIKASCVARGIPYTDGAA